LTLLPHKTRLTRGLTSQSTWFLVIISVMTDHPPGGIWAPTCAEVVLLTEEARRPPAGDVVRLGRGIKAR
jgi:hypothetical protein